jgi:serine/threonine protein phosphatase PrpC
MIREHKMECPKCGMENREGAKFCFKCGESLVVAPMPAAPSAALRAGADETAAPSTVGDRAQLNEVIPPLADADAAAASIEQRVQAADAVLSLPKDEPAVAAPVVSAPLPTLTPLAIGAPLQERYTVLEVVRVDADVIVYCVRDALRCPDPNCRTENSLDDKFCYNCGRELTERGTCLLEERVAPADAAGVAPPAFVVDGRVYTVQEETPAIKEAKPFPQGVRLMFGCKSDVGLARGALGEHDEDSIFALVLSALYESVAQPTVGLFIVADGIGGSEAGEVASKKCVQVVVDELMRTVVAPLLDGETLSDEPVREHIRAAIASANAQIFELAQVKKNDMGTTITLALVVNDNAYIANVGDSRTYLFADGKLQQVTRDHSLVASLIATGRAQPEEIYTHPQRNLIFRSLGAKPEVDIDLFPLEGGALEPAGSKQQAAGSKVDLFPVDGGALEPAGSKQQAAGSRADLFPVDGGALKLKPGARLLLCCDGLWEMVRDFDIEEHLLLEPDPQKVCDKLVTRANEAGGEDNVSVVVINVA